MTLNENFIEFIQVLNKHNVKYVLVGGWAVIFEGYSRATGDIDFLVEPSEANAERILLVLTEFFGSAIGFTKDDFTKEDNVVMLGRVPYRIDLLTAISGVTFESAYASSKIYKDGEVEIRCIHLNELIKNKESSGRLKDLADADKLKRIRTKREQKK